VRIIGGDFKGLRLSVVGSGQPSAHLRPTSDRVRESIFNLLINGGYGDPVRGALVLDLFAGTGALGLEALSRGAKNVVFVDDGKVAAGLIRKNIELCHMQDRVTLLRHNALTFKNHADRSFDLVFLDPPYGKNMGQVALTVLQGCGALAAGSLAVWEENSQQSAPIGFDMLDVRRYGGTWVHILSLTNSDRDN